MVVTLGVSLAVAMIRLSFAAASDPPSVLSASVLVSCALVLEALVPDALVPEALPSAEQPAVIPMANATAMAGNRPRIHFFFILFHLRCFIRMSFSNILPFIITHILFQ